MIFHYSTLPLVSLILLSQACSGASNGSAPLEFTQSAASDRLNQGSAEKNALSLTADDTELTEFLDESELKASAEGKRILQMGRAMIDARIIIIGSCWDYISAVFIDAGFAGKNHFTFYDRPKMGPYAEASELQPGDWLYIINHSYGDVEHSGIFIGWTDESLKEGLLLSYAGGSNNAPARYRIYDLSSVYHIMRPKAGLAETLPPLVLPTPAPERPLP